MTSQVFTHNTGCPKNNYALIQLITVRCILDVYTRIYIHMKDKLSRCASPLISFSCVSIVRVLMRGGGLAYQNHGDDS